MAKVILKGQTNKNKLYVRNEPGGIGMIPTMCEILKQWWPAGSGSGEQTPFS